MATAGWPLAPSSRAYGLCGERRPLAEDIEAAVVHHSVEPPKRLVCITNRGASTHDSDESLLQRVVGEVPIPQDRAAAAEKKEPIPRVEGRDLLGTKRAVSECQ